MIHEETNYVYGVHCGDTNCYSCTTMQGECAWLDAKDKLEDYKNGTLDLSTANPELRHAILERLKKISK